ncbi:MAG: hypothetical protein JJE03_07760 [Peptostreptococcaceae bacterium]|nr:hypothetical protein [Peptostreptococcaceae bacterium]
MQRKEREGMMRDYQRQKGNKYLLPRTLYHQTIWQIREYYRLKSQVDAILEESPSPPDGQPHGTGIGDEVACKVIRRENKMSVIKVIEKEKNAIPKEYRDGVWDNIQFGAPYPMDADRTTYGRYKSRFVYNIAKGLYLL